MFAEELKEQFQNHAWALGLLYKVRNPHQAIYPLRVTSLYL